MQLVDLSNNNVGPIDFHQVAGAGVVGVWLKVTEGTTFVDPHFAKRAAAARSAGLRVGGYHFAHPNERAQTSAELFALKLGAIGPHDLRPVLDLEQLDGEAGVDVVSWARTFNQALLARVHVGPIFYSNPATIAALAPTTPIGYGLWLADYGPDDGSEHPAAAPAPWQHLVAHQYTSKGTVAGIPGQVDRSSAGELRPLLAYPPPPV